MSHLLHDLIAGAQHQAAIHEQKAAALLADKPGDPDAQGQPTSRPATQRERNEALVEQERARQLFAWVALARNGGQL